MNKILFIKLYLITVLPIYGQNQFPKFTYQSVYGDTISNKTLLNKSTLIVVGHLSCPGMLFLLKDIQKVNIDTIQVILLLENTKEQVLAFNLNDTNDIWGLQRLSFRIKPIEFPTVTFCDKEKLGKKQDGSVIIKSQCNKLKIKYGAFEIPKIYAINNYGQIISKQTGWYYKLTDPQKNILELFKTKQ
jgi:hypothetical protein